MVVDIAHLHHLFEHDSLQIRNETSQEEKTKNKRVGEEKHSHCFWYALKHFIKYKHYVNRPVYRSCAFSPSHHIILNNLLTQDVAEKTVKIVLKHHLLNAHIDSSIISTRMILYTVHKTLASMHFKMTQFNFQLHKHIWENQQDEKKREMKTQIGYITYSSISHSIILLNFFLFECIKTTGKRCECKWVNRK